MVFARRFFNSIVYELNNNLSLKVISLLIAIFLWFFVLGSRNVDVTKEVPIEVITPTDLVIANDVPDRIGFKLSGPKAFLRTLLNRKEEPIRVNLTTAKPGLVTYRFFSDNIQVPIGVKVQAINPTAVIVKLEPIKRKEVPIKLLLKGDLPLGYKLNRLELLKPTIVLKGAESKIDQVVEAATTQIDLANLKESGQREVALDLAKLPTNVLVEGDLPKISFEVIQAAGEFKVKNIKIRALTNKHFEIEPNEITAFIKCNPDDLKKIDRQKLVAIVDLRSKGVGNYEVQPTLNLPATIKLIKILPQKVKVKLQ